MRWTQTSRIPIQSSGFNPVGSEMKCIIIRGMIRLMIYIFALMLMIFYLCFQPFLAFPFPVFWHSLQPKPQVQILNCWSLSWDQRHWGSCCSSHENHSGYCIDWLLEQEFESIVCQEQQTSNDLSTIRERRWTLRTAVSVFTPADCNMQCLQVAGPPAISDFDLVHGLLLIFGLWLAFTLMLELVIKMWIGFLGYNCSWSLCAWYSSAVWSFCSGSGVCLI